MEDSLDRQQRCNAAANATSYQPLSAAVWPAARVPEPACRRYDQQFINYLQYPLLYASGAGEDGDLGFGSYDSLQVTASHRSSALFVSANYTWSKTLGFVQTIVAGGNISSGLDLLCNRCNRNYTSTDIPNRAVVTAVYQLPWNKGQRWQPDSRLAREIVGGWSISPVVTFQGGNVITLSGLSGQFTGRVNYVGGKGAVPLVLPKSYQHWYNGSTKVTLPCGIQVTPSIYTRLKYNACAFGGPTVTTPNGTILADEYWYANGNQTNGDIRGPSRANVAASLRKTIDINERFKLDVTAEATNLMNSAEWSSSPSSGAGGTTVVNNPANGQILGLPQGNGYGTWGMGTFAPREIEMVGRIVF